MTTLILALTLLSAPAEFPMEATGHVGAYSFFHQDIEHFIYASISSDVRVLRVGPFSWHVGLTMDTYMGESWNSPEMKFNIYGGHWNIQTQFDYLLDPVLLRLYTDHECFHNIDMADTLSEYMNNIKLGALLDDPPDRFSPSLEWAPAGLPDGFLSVGLYRPQNETFQKGHNFNWSMHGETDFPVAAWRSWLGGVRYHADLFFHNDGDTSSRHWAEIYADYQGSAGTFELHLTHYLRDTQPFRSLEGETYWGVRFLW
jgi:hypothetical protein